MDVYRSKIMSKQKQANFLMDNNAKFSPFETKIEPIKHKKPKPCVFKSK